MQKGKEGVLEGMEEKKKRQKKVEVVGQQTEPCVGRKICCASSKNLGPSSVLSCYRLSRLKGCRYTVLHQSYCGAIPWTEYRGTA